MVTPPVEGLCCYPLVEVSPLLVVNKITSNPELSKLLNIDLEHGAVARGLSSIYYI